MKRLNQLDGFRVFMIGLIILSHFEFLSKYSYGDFYNTYLHNPTVAVDYFFMLSGFGMFYGLHNKEVECVTLKNCVIFAINKVKKIYPVYVCSLLIAMPYIIYSRRESFSLFSNLIEVLKEFMLDLTLLQSATLTMSLSHSINGVCWFLSTLFICYMLCPVFLKLFKKKLTNINACLIGLFAVIVVLVILSYVFNNVNGKYSIGSRLLDDFTYGSPIIRCWYVAIGMILAKLNLLIENKCNMSKKTGTIIEAICMIITFLYIIYRNSLNMILGKRLMDVMACVVVLFVISLGKGMISHVLSNKKIANIGKRTMYIYLLHYPIRHYVVYILFRNIYFGEITGIVICVTIVALSQIASIVLCKVYEKCMEVWNETKKIRQERCKTNA